MCYKLMQRCTFKIYFWLLLIHAHEEILITFRGYTKRQILAITA